ncbi:MAG: hypothetical protein ACYDBQ_08575 [Thermoplasmatota archaeon]
MRKALLASACLLLVGAATAQNAGPVFTVETLKVSGGPLQPGQTALVKGDWEYGVNTAAMAPIMYASGGATIHWDAPSCTSGVVGATPPAQDIVFGNPTQAMVSGNVTFHVAAGAVPGAGPATCKLSGRADPKSPNPFIGQARASAAVLVPLAPSPIVAKPAAAARASPGVALLPALGLALLLRRT